MLHRSAPAAAPAAAVFALFCVAAASSGTVAAAQDVAVGDTIYAGTDTYLRPEAGYDVSEEDSVAQVSEGERFVVKRLSSEGKFAAVTKEGREGWLYHYDFISSEKAAQYRRSRKKAQRRKAYRDSVQAREDSLERARQKEKRERRRSFEKLLREEGFGISLLAMKTLVGPAGGISPNIRIANITQDKTIKYAYFTLTPYNAVGDVAKRAAEGDATRTLRGIGPQGPSESAWHEFENVWQSEEIGCVEIRKIRIEHMDGSFATYGGDDLGTLKLPASGMVKTRGECKEALTR
jgi:hypothetical protein